MRKSYGQIVRRYATALFESALEANGVVAVSEQANALLGILGAYVVKFFISPMYSEVEKKEALESLIVAVKAHDVLAGTLRTMLANNRLEVVGEVLRQYLADADTQQGILRAEVHSARPLSSAELSEIEKSLSNASRKKVILASQVDEALKAGYIIKIGNTVVDASLRSRLTDLKESLSQGV